MPEKLLLLLVLALLFDARPDTANHGHSNWLNAPSNSAKPKQTTLTEQDGRRQPGTPQPRTVLTGHGRDCELAFDPAGQVLAGGCSRDSAPTLWNPSTGAIIARLSGHDDGVGRLSFSPDGQIVAMWSYDSAIRLWDVRTGELKAVLTEPKGFVRSVAFSPDSRSLATESIHGFSAHLWDMGTGGLKTTLDHQTLEKDPDFVVGVAFAPDGKTLVTATYLNIYLWDVGTAKVRVKLIDPDVRISTPTWRTVKGFSHGDTIYGLAISPDGRTLATVSRDATAKLWDLESGRLKATLQHEGKVLTLTFSHDSNTLATGSEDRKARLWVVSSGKLIATLPHKGTVHSLSFSADNAVIATASDNEKVANVWRVATGEKIAELPKARPPVVFSPIGRTLATASRTSDVLLWDVEIK